MCIYIYICAVLHYIVAYNIMLWLMILLRTAATYNITLRFARTRRRDVRVVVRLFRGWELHTCDTARCVSDQRSHFASPTTWSKSGCERLSQLPLGLEACSYCRRLDVTATGGCCSMRVFAPSPAIQSSPLLFICYYFGVHAPLI